MVLGVFLELGQDYLQVVHGCAPYAVRQGVDDFDQTPVLGVDFGDIRFKRLIPNDFFVHSLSAPGRGGEEYRPSLTQSALREKGQFPLRPEFGGAKAGQAAQLASVSDRGG
jgi:hypothetical protein